MTTSTGKTGRGVFFEMSDGQSPPNWTTVANPTQVSPTGRTSEEIDFTTLLSTGGFKEFRQGFKDPGSIAVDYHFDVTDPSHQALLDRWLSGLVFECRINFSAVGWNYALVGLGYVKDPGDLTIDVSNPIKGVSTIRFTGETQFQPI